MRADEMPAKGDVDGYAVWKWTMRAVQKWLRQELRDDELRD